VDFVDGLEDRFEMLTIVMQRQNELIEINEHNQTMAFAGMDKHIKCTAR
jgi:hypothetical protein